MSLHPLLKQQIEDARRQGGRIDLQRLLQSIGTAYSEWDDERRGVVRSMRMLADETSAVTREVRESAAAQLQAILDHVKDAILTVDDDGRVETVNSTAERVFGCDEAAVRGRRIDLLIPALARYPNLTDALEELAEGIEDTQADLMPRETRARRQDGVLFDAELGVSKVRLDRREIFIVCLRDTSDRKRAEGALRESEARYRTLVENAPEAIVVYDVDLGRFVECNENAVRFFKVTREQLLGGAPALPGAPELADGGPPFGISRGYLDRALAGEAPCFEWTHRDGAGQEIPCEVRLVRLPSSSQRLIRGSITDITERKRAELLAAGERRVFERITGDAGLPETLEAIAEVAERVTPDTLASVSLYRAAEESLVLVTGRRLPTHFRRALESVTVGPRGGSCAAAVYLQRQVVVAEIARDAFWDELRSPALSAGLRACWSTPIRASDGRILGTLALYFQQPRSPLRRDFELMGRLTALAAIAIEREQAEAALRCSEARYRGLFENVIEGVYRATAEGRIEAANPALVEMLGFGSVEELLALPSTQLLYPYPEDRAQVLRCLDRDGLVRDAEYALRRKDGTVITVVENARVVRDLDGAIVGYEGTLADVTERKRAELQLADEKEKAQVTLQSIGDAVITVDAEGRIEYLNPVAEQLTGFLSAEVAGQPVAEVIRLLGESSGKPIDNPILRCLGEGRIVELDEPSLLVNRHGREISIQDSAAPIRDRSGRLIGAVMVFHDVSQERRLQRALAYQATHDLLTGLINRREFDRRLAEALATARDDPSLRHVLLYLDLDQFKVVNDTCGHQAGDRLLKQITGVLQTRIRASDVLARLGGDEFGVLLCDCPLETAHQIAESLRTAVRDFRFLFDDRVLKLGVSIGVAEVDARVDTPEAVMSAADLACNSAKESGRNRVQTHHGERTTERLREMQWVSRINRAREENRFELLCQTILPIRAGLADQPHFELLLRMRDEHGALVEPAAFIPAAERYNLMPLIDRWVVEQACRQHAYRRGDSTRHPYVLDINVSATSLNDETFLDHVLAEIAEADVAPESLCFELTEAAAMTSLATVRRFVDELRRRGCRFSLDDFGSGLSSFLFLKNLRVDFLKIDGQFLQNVTRDPVDRQLVESIVQIGRAMDIRTVAERVDSAEVLDCLAEIGIEYAQGHYIGVPQPVAALRTLVLRARDDSRQQA